MTAAASSLPPDFIGRYAVLRVLSPARTYLAQDDTGRRVVLKILDADCLLRGQLHPSIHDRLARVRELAHIGVAHLYGVERDGSLVFAVWEFIPGQSLPDHAARLSSPQALARLARELILAVESLHVLGIVHGALHGGNIIVDEVGQVRLTHISPLLFDDPAVDGGQLAQAVGEAAAARGWADSPAGRLPAMAAEHAPLAQMRVQLMAGAESVGPLSPECDGAGRRFRRLALLAAVGVALAAVGIAVAIALLARSAQPPAYQPPQAPPDALRASP